MAADGQQKPKAKPDSADSGSMSASLKLNTNPLGGPYLETPEDISLLNLGRWEHVADPEQESTRRLAGGLRSERRWFEASGVKRATTALVILADAGEQTDGIRETLGAWRLQSDPSTASLVLGPITPAARGERDPLLAVLSETAWCLFARPGDLLHPSVSASLRQHANGADVVLWSQFIPDPHSPGHGVVHRRPQFDPHTIRHNPTLDTTFAVRGKAIAGCPNEVLQALRRGRAHPLLFWLSMQIALRWRTWAEALAVRPATRLAPPALSRPVVEGDIELYRAISKPLEEVFDLRETRADLPLPFVMTPRVRAGMISVIINMTVEDEFRVLRTLYAIASQRTSASIEIVLAGGEEAASALSSVAANAQRTFGPDAVKIVSSKQLGKAAGLNAACRAATGDVLLFCNPWVRMETDGIVMEELAAWALVPGLATIGCGLAAPRRNDGSVFGLVGSNPAAGLYAGLLDAEQDDVYCQTVRSCAGNMMSLAAISRTTFAAVGGLDEERFSEGLYEDEFMLRCTRHGLTHLYIGHLRATQDAAPDDERMGSPLARSQLRQLYPEAAQAAFFALTRQAPTASDRSSLGYSPEDLETLAAAAARKLEIQDDLKRGMLEEVSRVTDASGELLDALQKLQALTSIL